MMHPLIHLIATRPQWVADHAQAYAELLGDETAHAYVVLKRRALLHAIALGSATVAVALAGVALMLWATVPVGQIHAPWALIVAPLLPLAVALCCALGARSNGEPEAFSGMREQLRADWLMLRAASPS